jgi:hypothetical protein
MTIERHSLAKELPEYRDQIHTLKMNDNHFARFLMSITLWITKLFVLKKVLKIPPTII